MLGGVPERHIFYSSSRATGIPSGEEVRPYLQRSLREAGLVIELISETFLSRPMCLMELGGAWTLGTPTYPIVVPPLTLDVTAKQIGNVQMGVLGRGSDIDDLFDELHDRLTKDVDIRVETTPWNRAIREFKLQLSSRLGVMQADSVTASSVASAPSPATKQATNKATARDAKQPAETVTIGNVSIANTRRGRELHGEATNNDNVEHGAVVQATFYNAEGQIIDTEKAAVLQLRPGDRQTFNMRHVPDHDHSKVQLTMVSGS